MEHITTKDLERAVKRLNERLGRPIESYSKDENGKYQANLGCFSLGGAYGGYQLQEIVSEGGGIRLHTSGFVPKRELYNIIHAMINGSSLTV